MFIKALLLQEKGEWKEMRVSEINSPAPDKGEILVEVHAVGLPPKLDVPSHSRARHRWRCS